MEPFQEDSIERTCLTTKPKCFILVGKPGSGKTSLATRLAATWNCQLINGASSVEQAIRDETELGNEARELLLKGEAVPSSLVAEIIEEKIQSPEVEHYGYVLDGLPCQDPEWMSPVQQMEWIFKWKPDIIVNIKVPDKDLVKRMEGQKVDPLSGKLYSEVDLQPRKLLSKGDQEEEEGEEEDDEEQPTESVPPAVLERLVRRTEDTTEKAKERISAYKHDLLKPIEGYIAVHRKDFVVELDGNLKPDDLFKALAVKLTALLVIKSPAPKRLVNDPEEMEDMGGLDEDSFIEALAHREMVAPRHRWRRSLWGVYCPVELAKGNMVQGRLEFSVGFLDKIYSLSSPEALVAFTRCPRSYLLPPQPEIPFKVCVVGPPTSGKTALSKALALHYSAQVISVQDLVLPLREKAKAERIEKLKAEEIAKAISLVSNKLKEQELGEATPTVTEEHPEVLAYVSAAVDKLPPGLPPATNEMLVEVICSKVKELDAAKEEMGSTKQHGGWIVDGFPETREQWSVMLERQTVPDQVLVLSEVDGEEGTLLNRISEELKDQDKIDKWSKRFQEFKQHWTHLSAAIKGSAVEPSNINCNLNSDQVTSSAIRILSSVFQHRPVQFSALEEDADADDDPPPGGGEEEEDEEPVQETELQRLSRKPWGASLHYCPVVLTEQGVLWPGNSDHAIKFRDKLYFCSSEDAKDKFERNPASYTELVQVPPFRVYLLGPSGAGKSLAGRRLSEEKGLFHISFKQHLHELLLPKLKQPFFGEDNYRDDTVPEVPNDDKEDEDAENEEEVDLEFKEPLSADEKAIHQYLKEDIPLPEELLCSITERFWKEEPYKSTGFVLEGFPTTAEEVRSVSERGMFPDAVVIMEVTSQNVVKRFGPGRLRIWREKKDNYLKTMKERKDCRFKIWSEDRNKRRSELIEEHERIKAEKEQQTADSDTEEERGEEDGEEEEFQEKLKEIDDEVFEDEEEIEEVEEELAAKERINMAILEMAEEQMESVLGLMDVFEELLVPVFKVDGNRMRDVAFYCLSKSLRHFLEGRAGMLLKNTPVNEETAQALVDSGYKYMSQFGYSCPVQVTDGGDIFSANRNTGRCPVVLGQRVYYFSSEANRKHFLENPEPYIHQPAPLPFLPPHLSIQGPPNSGKTTVAEQLAAECGLVRASVGDALRYHLEQFPESHLSTQVKGYLREGEEVPDELAVSALERYMLQADCNTRGVVLDGWPVTKKQVDLLNQHHILPLLFIELKVSEQACMARAQLQCTQLIRGEPLHNSPTVTRLKLQTYAKHAPDVKEWYSGNHRNWHSVDGELSRWMIWSQVQSLIRAPLKEVQNYINCIPQGKAASVKCLCITPEQFSKHLGEFESYCPVSWSSRGELVDCSVDEQYNFAAEYKSKYYRFASETELQKFLENPESFIPPACKRLLPARENRPRCLTEAEVKALFPKQMELQGFCPVTYVDGDSRYECLVAGSAEVAVQYNEKLYCFRGEPERQKFLKLPEKYSSVKVPAKLPPLKQPLVVNSLPILGYLEQKVATCITNSLTAAGCFKPKLPFTDPYTSALTYVAYHLKAYNPASPRYLRDKYRKKLVEMEEKCLLVKDISSGLLPEYQNPQTQPAIFKTNLNSFLQLKTVNIVQVDS